SSADRKGMTDEKQDLDNLTKHPGWLRLRDYGLKEIEGRINTAIGNAANQTDDVMALNLLRQCIAAKQAIEQLLAWPESRLKVLTAADARDVTTTQLSRRGNL